MIDNKGPRGMKLSPTSVCTSGLFNLGGEMGKKTPNDAKVRITLPGDVPSPVSPLAHFLTFACGDWWGCLRVRCVKIENCPTLLFHLYYYLLLITYYDLRQGRSGRRNKNIPHGWKGIKTSRNTLCFILELRKTCS